MGKSKDWVVWCRSRPKDEEERLFEVDGKEIFSIRSRPTKAKTGEKMDKKGGKGQSVRLKAWWRQSNIKCTVSEEYASCWVHQDCHVADEQKAALKKATGVSGEKDGMSSAIEREITRLLVGHRDRHARRLWVSGPSNGR